MNVCIYICMYVCMYVCVDTPGRSGGHAEGAGAVERSGRDGEETRLRY